MTTDNLVPSSVLGIHHLGLAVRDLEKAIAFYSEPTLSVLEDEQIFSQALHEPDQCAVLKGPTVPAVYAIRDSPRVVWASWSGCDSYLLSVAGQSFAVSILR